MGATRDLADAAYSDFVTPGVPSSGNKKPKKSEIRNLFSAIDALITAIQITGTATAAQVAAANAAISVLSDSVDQLASALGGSGTSFYATKTALNADLVPAAGFLVQIYNDPDFVANEFFWQKVGATTTGSWTQTAIPTQRYLDRILAETRAAPGLRNGFLANNNDKYDAVALKDSSDRLVLGASQRDGTIKVGRWDHKPLLARHDPYEPGGYPCNISGGDVVVTTDNGLFTIDGASYTFSACGPGSTFVCAAWDKPAMASSSAVQIDRNGEIFAVYGKTLATGFVGYGQSNGSASRAVGEGMSVNPDPDHIWMPDTGYSSDLRLNLNTAAGVAPVLAPGAIIGFVPMDSVPGELAFTSGQTPIETLCYALHDEIMRKLNYAPVMIGATFAVGGFSLSQLTVGTQPYDNLVLGVTEMTSAALADGYRYWLPLIDWQGGESDATNANYASEMVALRTGFNTDLKPITAQASDIWVMLTAPASFAKGQDKAVTAMADLHRDEPTGFVLSHPMYMLDFDIYEQGSTSDDDYVHLSVRGQQINGEYKKKTWRKTIYGKSRPDPLINSGPGVLSGTTITIPMLVPVAPMVIDTTIVTERSGTNKGLVFVDDSGSPPTITNVAVSGSNLVLTLSGASTGSPSSRFVEAGLEGHDGSAPFTLSEMARLNIRDSDPARAVFDPTFVLYNWMMPDRIPVTV